MQDFKNPNVFQPNDTISVVQVHGPLSIRCPHCKQIGGFTSPLGNAALYRKTVAANAGSLEVTASIRVCPNQKCKGVVFAIHQGLDVLSTSPPERLDFIPDGIPANIVETLTEAISCHAAEAYRAAALMVRRLLEELCDHFNSEGKNLHQRLEGIKAKVPMSDALFEGAMELKALGNDAAHISARAYDTVGKQESELSIEVATEILKALFQHQSLLQRLKELKKPGRE